MIEVIITDDAARAMTREAGELMLEWFESLKNEGLIKRWDMGNGNVFISTARDPEEYL